MNSARPLTRRSALIAGAGCLVAACGFVPSPDRPATAGSPPAGPPRPALPPPPAALIADSAPYMLHSAEVEPSCKAAAVAYVSTALTVGTASTQTTTPEQRLRQSGHNPVAAKSLTALLPTSGASTVEVVYPQYGGLVVGSNACVMLVAEQHTVTAPGAPVARRTLSLDVRLVADRGRWQVTEIIPAAQPAPVLVLSESVEAVLASDRIVLPDAARADLYAGTIDDRVAEALLAAADRWQVHVQVLTGGHPRTVWNTNRVSNHTSGRAVDIWALDGVPVIDGDRCPWPELVRVGAAAGASELGSPHLIGVRGGFTDAVHQDHVHFGF